jgi:hypothetical protein
MIWLALLCTCASRRAWWAIPANAAAGASDANSTVSAAASVPVGSGPASASARNGTGRAASHRRAPRRPSRYRAISWPVAPAIVIAWKSASDSTLAADTATAAPAGRRRASGNVVVRASRHSTRANCTVTPLTTARANDSTTATNPSTTPAGAGGAATMRRPLSNHRSRLLTESIVAAGGASGVPFVRDVAVPPAGDGPVRRPSHQRWRR